MRALRSAVIAWVVIAIGILAHAPQVGAAYDPVGTGVVSIRFDRAFLSFLRTNGVKVATESPAHLGKGFVSLPATGGIFDPTSKKGSIDTEGSVLFVRGRKRIPLREVTAKTKASPLVAKVGGSQLKVASSRVLEVTRNGFGAVFTARQLHLSSKAAVRLNKKLRPERPFFAGQRIGSLSSRVSPELVTILDRNAVSVDFSPTFAAKLNELFVAVNPIFPTEHTGAAFTFPIIAGGAIAPTGSLGTLKSGGAIEFLQLGSNSQIFMQEFWLDLGARLGAPELDLEPSPPFGGKLGRRDVFGLGPGTVRTDSAARTIQIADTPMTLKESTATTFNDAFAHGKQVFEAGEIAASASWVAQAQ